MVYNIMVMLNITSAQYLRKKSLMKSDSQARGRLDLDGEPTREHEDFAIVTLEPMP